jgi:hypothetical protein
MSFLSRGRHVLPAVAALGVAASISSSVQGMTGYLLVSLQPSAASFGIADGVTTQWGQGTAWSANSSGVAAMSSYWKAGTPSFGSYPTNVANGVLSTPPYPGTSVLPLASSGSSFKYSGAYGINNTGTVVGIAATGSTLSGGHAAVWNNGAISVSSGFATNFGTESASALYSVNDNDNAVGYIAAGGSNHAAIYTPTGLGLIPGTVANGQSLAVARGISQTNLIVGSSQGGNTTVSAYTYDLDLGTLTTIPLPSNVTTYTSGTTTYSYVNNTAAGVSQNGRYVVGAVGGSRSGSNPSFVATSGFFSQIDSLGYIYDTTTGVATALPIGTSGDLATGALGYYATSVNDAGWVVGTGPNVKSFVFDGAATYDPRQYLVNPSVTTQISNLDYIDDNGNIYGTAFFNGVNVPVVLVPVPEPTSAGALGLGGLGLGLARRRR